MKFPEWDYSAVTIVDLRIPDEERSLEGQRSRELCWKINQTNPTDPKLKQMIRELFQGRIGEHSKLHPPLFFNLANNVWIGDHVSIMNNLQVMAAGGLIIEDDVRISLNCTIATNNHDMYERDILTCQPVRIGQNAWLGVNVTILPGVQIGRNAVIGANSLVTRDIPDNAVAVGSPARVIRYLDPDRFPD